MKTIHVCKYGPLSSSQTSDGVVIAIDIETPSFNGIPIKQVEAFFREQADELAGALFDNLLQGTTHRLLGSLLEKYAPVYRGKS